MIYFSHGPKDKIPLAESGRILYNLIKRRVRLSFVPSWRPANWFVKTTCAFFIASFCGNENIQKILKAGRGIFSQAINFVWLFLSSNDSFPDCFKEPIGPKEISDLRSWESLPYNRASTGEPRRPESWINGYALSGRKTASDPCIVKQEPIRRREILSFFKIFLRGVLNRRAASLACLSRGLGYV